MSMQKLVAFLVILAVVASLRAAPPASVPRKSPEFTIVEPSGKTTLLSSFKGKVVVIEFLFTQSPHCLRVAATLNKLNTELAPRGFQPIAIAFAPPGTVVDGPVVQHVVDYFKLRYPVGYTSSDKVDSYLGREENEILNIPQVVVIDRAGMIRAMSGGRGGDAKLEEENSLRNLIDSLLKEAAPASSAKKKLTSQQKS